MKWLMIGFVCLIFHPDFGLTSIYKSTNIECKGNPYYAQNVKCVIKAKSWYKAVAQMDCDILVPLRNMTVHLQVFKKDYSNRYQPFLVNVVIPMCDIMSKRSFFVYGTLFWKVLKKYTNVNHSCPLEGHLFARDLLIDNDSFPNSPLGFYKMLFKFYENYPDRSENVGNITFYVQNMETRELKPKITDIDK